MKEPTNVREHTLNVVITREIVSCLGFLTNLEKATYNHFAVFFFNLHAAKPYPVRKTVSFRKFRAINIESFKQDIAISSALSNSLNS